VAELDRRLHFAALLWLGSPCDRISRAARSHANKFHCEKIYSIFEPIRPHQKRGKVQTPIEFGHKFFLAESARGLITTV